MTHFIIFSKDRPLQLHGCLTSLLKHLRGEAKIDVLVRVETDYEDAYREVQAEFTQVTFTRETDFAADMERLTTEPSDTICFMCDDVLTINDIDLSDVDTVLTSEHIIGVSFRLGANMHIGMFGNLQPQPDFFETGSGGQFIEWDMTSAVGDWCYPFDVLGTVYRRSLIMTMWSALKEARNPSQFENIGSQAWKIVTPQQRYAAWTTSRTVTPTPNVVQTEFGNGFIGHAPLDPLFLLVCWNYGMRLDTERYDSMTFSSWRIGDIFLKRVG